MTDTPEPTGTWAVVRDADGHHWQRIGNGSWRCDHYDSQGWKTLRRPVQVLFEGIDE